MHPSIGYQQEHAPIRGNSAEQFARIEENLKKNLEVLKWNIDEAFRLNSEYAIGVHVSQARAMLALTEGTDLELQCLALYDSSMRRVRAWIAARDANQNANNSNNTSHTEVSK